MVHASGIHEQTGLDLAERILSGELGIENRFELTDGGEMFATPVSDARTEHRNSGLPSRTEIPIFF